ncbi:MAG: septum formation initiator family protein [Rikenellaceae bacterium]|jgi:cell division protein FtsB|nr:septum formation initiator family protein [Rikenellaceae bacterium]
MQWKALAKSHRVWVITIAAFVLLVTFFDNDNLLDRWKIKGRIRDLERQRDYYQSRITEDSTLLNNLKDDTFLEQYARENFRMRRAGETVYLIEEK